MHLIKPRVSSQNDYNNIINKGRCKPSLFLCPERPNSRAGLRQRNACCGSSEGHTATPERPNKAERAISCPALMRLRVSNRAERSQARVNAEWSRPYPDRYGHMRKHEGYPNPKSRGRRLRRIGVDVRRVRW